MGSLMKIVVLLTIITAVLCTPFINQLPEGQEWPVRSSVKQPKPENEEPGKVTNGDIKSPEDATEVDKADGDVAEAELVSVKDEEPERVDYSGCQVWKVSTTKSSAKKVINKLASEKLIASWGGNRSSIDVLVKPKAIENVTSILNSKKIPYDIMIEDLQRNINDENPPLEESEIELQDRRARAYNFWRYRAPHRRLGFINAYMGYNSLNIPMEYWPNANWGHRMTWKQYHRIDDIHGFMDYLAKTYPSIVSVNTIGSSYEGRDLKVLRISDGKPNNKAVFIDGGIHAREWISPAVVTYFINQFAENFDVESDDVKNIDWYFLPVVNPDGYEYTHRSDRLWRKNRKGVLVCTGCDLNRNFGYKWGGKGASNNPCSEIYRGGSAFSEPESRAIEKFFTSTGAKFSAYLSYHSYGQYILYPWGYDNAVTPDHKDLQYLGEEMAKTIQNTGGSKYKVGSASATLYPASGGSDDWVKSIGVKYTYTVELSDTGRYGFVLPASYIEPVARENLAGLRVLARQTIQNTGGSKYKVGSASATLYPASGGSDDWVKSIGVKYTYTVELSDTGRYGFVLPASYIEPVARENLAGLRVLARQVNKE